MSEETAVGVWMIAGGNVVDRKSFSCPSTCQIFDLFHVRREDRSAVGELSPKQTS